VNELRRRARRLAWAAVWCFALSLALAPWGCVSLAIKAGILVPKR
jgi:hypothetical protein